MLVSQTIDDVSGGVSQQPQGMRVGNQLAEQINAISYFGRATMRRPPLRHVAKLTSSFAGGIKVFLHEILRSTTARFHLIVSQGDLQVFDAFTGIQQPIVYFPNGKAPPHGQRSLASALVTFSVTRRCWSTAAPSHAGEPQSLRSPHRAD